MVFLVPALVSPFPLSAVGLKFRKRKKSAGKGPMNLATIKSRDDLLSSSFFFFFFY